MTLTNHAIVVIALVAGLVTGCSTGSVSKEEGDALMKRAQASGRNGTKSIRSLRPLRRKVMALLSSRRSARAGWSLVEPMVKASFTRKANTSATPISPRCHWGFRPGIKITAS
jgi:hypothetical protein